MLDLIIMCSVMHVNHTSDPIALLPACPAGAFENPHSLKTLHLHLSRPPSESVRYLGLTDTNVLYHGLTGGIFLQNFETIHFDYSEALKQIFFF